MAKYAGVFNKLNHYVDSKNKIKSENLTQQIKSIMTTQEPDNYVITNLNTRAYSISASDGCILEIFSTALLKVKKEHDYYLINGEDKLYLNLKLENSDARGVLKTKDKIIVLDGSYLKNENETLLSNDVKGNYIVEVMK